MTRPSRCSSTVWLAVAALVAPAACSVGASSLGQEGGETFIPAPDAGSEGGAAGKAGAGGAAGKRPDAGADAAADVALDAPPDVAPVDAAPDVVVEPPGSPVLRFVHGVADAPTVRLCFVEWGATGPAESGPPSAELSFGSSLTLHPAEPSKDYRAAVVGGDLAAAGKVDCASVFAAPPPGVRVMPLPVIPAGTLSAPRSLLLVAAGCLGGATVADPAAVCTQLASPTQLSPAFALVELSRVEPPSGQASVQLVHASLNLPPVDASLVSSEGELRPLIPSTGTGAVAPKPPAPIDPAWLGALPKAARLDVSDAANGQVLAPRALGDELAASGLSMADVAPGVRLVAIVLGSRPSIADAGPPVPLGRVWLRVD